MLKINDGAAHRGVALNHLKTTGSSNTTIVIVDDAQKFIQQNLMQFKDDALALTSTGKLFADGIAADLFRI